MESSVDKKIKKIELVMTMLFNMLRGKNVLSDAELDFLERVLSEGAKGK